MEKRELVSQAATTFLPLEIRIFAVTSLICLGSKKMEEIEGDGEERGNYCVLER